MIGRAVSGPAGCRHTSRYLNYFVMSCMSPEIFSPHALENSACQRAREALSLLPHLGARVLKTVTPSL
jgi:hypothetical protein